MLEGDAAAWSTRSSFISCLSFEIKSSQLFGRLANCFASPRRNLQVSPEAYGRGAGVGRGRGVGCSLGVGVGLTVAVGVAVGVDDADAVAVAVGVAVTVAVGVGEGDAQGLTGQLKISIESKRVTPSDP